MIKLDVKMESNYETTLRLLAGVESDLKGRAVRHALWVAAKPIASAMRDLTPVDSGTLRSTIGRRNMSKTAAERVGLASAAAVTGNGETAFLIGPTRQVQSPKRKKDGSPRSTKRWLWGWLMHILSEKGAVPHEIQGRKLYKGRIKIVRKLSPRGRLYFNGRYFIKVQHPGISARNILSDAETAGSVGFQERFEAAMTAYVEKMAPPLDGGGADE